MGTLKKRRRHRLGLMVVLALCLGAGIALLPMTAGAVHDEGVFELDGNVTDDAAAGDDWATLFRRTRRRLISVIRL